MYARLQSTAETLQDINGVSFAPKEELQASQKQLKSAHTELQTVNEALTNKLRLMLQTIDRVAELEAYEQRLDDSDLRQIFLLKLSDTLRPLHDPMQIQAEACRLLGEYLNVNRVAYADIEGDEYVILPGYAKDVSLVSVRAPLASLGETVLDAYRRNEPIAVSDVRCDTRFTEAEQATLRFFDVAAFTGVLLVKDGRWAGTFGTHNATPREWTQSELELISDVADRIWSAVERACAESALRESYERLSFALEASNAGLYDHKVPIEDGAYHTGRWTNILGYQHAELPSETAFLEWLYARVHPDDVAYLQERYEAFVEGRRPDYEVTIRLRHKTGVWRWVQGVSTAVTRNEAGAVTRMVCVMTDITNLKQVEQEVRELNEQLEVRVEKRTQQVRDLAAQLTMAEHRERARISQVLHDDLQQQLYSLQIRLDFLEDHAANEAMLEELAQMEIAVRTATETTRRLSMKLSPPILEGEGLAQAVSWLASHIRRRFGLRVEVETEGSFAVMDLDRRVLLFQAVRELLLNVVKHADVSQATVRLQLVDDQQASQAGPAYRIDVIDKGVGFDTGMVLGVEAALNGQGLVHIRERLRFIDGRLEVHSIPGDGTWMTIIAAPAQGT